MVVFGFRSSESIDEFMKLSSKRADTKTFMFSKAIFKKVTDCYVVGLESWLPRGILWFFMILGLAALFFSIWTGVVIASILVLPWWFINSRYFIFLLLKAGLKKAKYKVKLSLIRDEELKEVLLNGAGRNF